jgi:hypothetical protein
MNKLLDFLAKCIVTIVLTVIGLGIIWSFFILTKEKGPLPLLCIVIFALFVWSVARLDKQI